MSEPVNLKFDTEITGHQTIQQTETVTTVESTYRYDALRDEDVNDFSSTHRPTLVTLFGISKCGKTTFVGSLFARVFS